MKRQLFSSAGLFLLTICAAAAFPQGAKMSLKLTSSSFSPGGDIPTRFTCKGEDVSPQLSWTNPPSGTQAFALIVDDPDAPAGTWTHWVLYNLPASAASLAEGISKVEQLPDGTLQGLNDFHKVGYGGPCPPPGKPHRYFFKLYALDRKLDLNPAASKKDLEQAMHGRVLGQAELMGEFKR